MAERTSREGASSSLIAAAIYVKRGPGAVSTGGNLVGRSAIAQRDRLYEYLFSRSEILNEGYCGRFHHIGGGAEHEVFFDLENRRAIKVTRSNNYGWSVDHEGAHATPFEYLRRLIWQNWFFGDDISLVGAIGSEGHMEIVTSQPWIYADRVQPPASLDQIREYFAEIGFRESHLYSSEGFFYHTKYNVVAADAHSRNVLLSAEGDIHPIDIVMGRPGEQLKARLLAEFGIDPAPASLGEHSSVNTTTTDFFEGTTSAD